MNKFKSLKLSDVFDFIRNGASIPQGKIDGGFPITRIETISDAKIDCNKFGYAGIDEDCLKRYADYILQDGDILLTHINSTKHLGKCAIYEGVPKTLIHGMNLLCFRPKKNMLIPSFANWFMKSKFFLNQLPQITNQSVNQSSISVTNFRKLEIPLPPLPEQQRIVALLDKADSLRQKRRQSLALMDEFLKSTFLEMFGDPNSDKSALRLSDVANINMGQSPTGESYNCLGSGSPLLNGPTEFGEKYPIEKQWTTKPTKFCDTGDILFCVRGATAGRLNWADKKYCIGRGLASIKSKGNVPNEFIYSFLGLKYDYFQQTGSGSTFINITKEQLHNLKFPNSEKKLQIKFAQIVEKTEAAKEKMKTQLIEMDNNFNGMMAEVFRG